MPGQGRSLFRQRVGFDFSVTRLKRRTVPFAAMADIAPTLVSGRYRPEGG